MYSIITELERLSREFFEVSDAISYGVMNFPSDMDWEIRDEDGFVVYTHYVSDIEDMWIIEN